MSDSTIYSIDATSPQWPALLREVPQKTQPKKLYIRGTLPPPDTLTAAIVGTRKPSAYGKEATRDIVTELARHNIAIVSGMALGIDSVAHKTALELGAPTIAVLGSGLDESVIYPKENTGLARAIVSAKGAVVSEYEPLQKPELWTFPQRNRIIAGIAKMIIVIEAGEKSGALITARLGAEYNRDVYALPGSIYNAMSQGANALIKDGASPITSIRDITAMLGVDIQQHQAPLPVLDTDESKIVRALHQELTIDDLIRTTNIAPHKALALTTSLEIRGIIKSTSAGTYRKV